jgi:hypothetical protein
MSEKRRTGRKGGPPGPTDHPFFCRLIIASLQLGHFKGGLLRPRRITRPVDDDGFDGAGHSYKVLEAFTAVEATCPPALVHGRDE